MAQKRPNICRVGQINVEKVTKVTYPGPFDICRPRWFNESSNGRCMEFDRPCQSICFKSVIQSVRVASPTTTFVSFNTNKSGRWFCIDKFQFKTNASTFACVVIPNQFCNAGDEYRLLVAE